MSDIFLSYKSEDRQRAKIIAEALKQHGYSVWWDKIIPPGKTFDQVIEEALDAARCVIVLWSRESVSSDWVKNEVREGTRRHILVPVLIDDVKIPFEFKHIQAAQLIDWQGALPDPEFDLLLKSVGEILGKPSVMKMEAKKSPIEEGGEGHRKLGRVIVAAVLLSLLLLGYWMLAPGLALKPTPSDFTNSIGMEFMRIPAGEFDMGSSLNEDYDKDEGPVHRVKIPKAFHMGRYEVTQKQWREVMGYDPSYFKGDNLPVEQVSWNDVQEFIKKLNEKESTNKYRLPSEAEWEYAARADTTTRYSFGDDESKLGDYAWYLDSKTHEVGKKKPNPWGLYDMHGNVWEWVQDVYHNNYNGAPIDGSAWEVDGSERVFRGGGWKDGARGCRSADRDKVYPGYRPSNLGFRLLRDL